MDDQLTAVPAVCSGTAVDCRQYGDLTFVVYPGATSAEQEVLLWDGGGPGLRPLDAGATRQALPDWTKGLTVVALVEPWNLNSAATEQCRRVLDGADADCSWRDLNVSGGQYQQSLREMQKDLGPLRFVIASSFGAVRSQPAVREALGNAGTVVLDSPAPPAGVDAGRFLEARWRSASDVAMQSPPCTSRTCVAARKERFEELTSGKLGVSAEDAQLAIMSAAYSPSENVDFFASLWTSSGELSRVAASSIRQSAANFARRDGEGGSRPELAGYLAQVCPAYGAWPATGDALAQMHAQCADFDRVAEGALDQERQKGGEVILVENQRDTVVPIAYQELWQKQFPGARVLRYSEQGHTAPPEDIWAKVAAVARSPRG